MKKYEKPRLIALSLGGNERLCGDCAKGLTLWNNEDGIKDRLEQGFLGYQIGDKDGILEKFEFENSFNANESCQNVLPLDSYCKFNGSGNNLIAWS